MTAVVGADQPSFWGLGWVVVPLLGGDWGVCVCVGGVIVLLICFVCSAEVEQGTHRDCLTRAVSK